MRYYPRLEIYKASNCTFNPKTIEAYSYNWWKFVACIDGLVVFNNYRYSNTTTRHQWTVRRLLNDLGIKIDIEAPFPRGIGNIFLESVILDAEEGLCNAFLNDEFKKIERNEKARARRIWKKTVEASVTKPTEMQTATDEYQGLRLVR